MASRPGDVALLISRLPGCARLSPDAAAALCGAGHVAEFPSGARLLTEGERTPDWYCVVETGGIDVTRVDANSTAILDHLGPYDVLDPGMPGHPAAWSATTVAPTRCLFLSQSTVGLHRGRLVVEASIANRSAALLFTRRVGDLVKEPTVTCAPTATVASAASL